MSINKYTQAPKRWQCFNLKYTQTFFDQYHYDNDGAQLSILVNRYDVMQILAYFGNHNRVLLACLAYSGFVYSIVGIANVHWATP